MGGGSDLQRLNARENLALGLLSGCGSKMVNYPLLNWKNCMQQSLPLSFSPKLVYRGLPMAMINFGGTTGVQFSFTAAFQKKIAGGSNRALTPREEMSGAFLGGFFSGVACSIWELTMIQQQRFGGSLLSAPLNLVQRYGMSSLTRGMVPSMGRESLFSMAMLGICPVLQRELMHRYSLEENTALAAGALTSSVFAATLTHPLDTVKTCMQGDVAQQRYTSMRGTAALIAAEHGVAKGLFKGLSFRIALISTAFFLVNQWKQVLAPVLFPPALVVQRRITREGLELPEVMPVLSGTS